jgi:hypothetical protein
VSIPAENFTAPNPTLFKVAPLLSHQAIFGTLFLSDNNLVVDAAARRVIQVPQLAEGGKDVDQGEKVDWGEEVNRGLRDVDRGEDFDWGGEGYRGGNVYRHGDVENHLTSHADSSNPTVSSPPSGKNKRRSRMKRNSDRARTQRRFLKKDGSWRYKDPLVRVGNVFIDLASMEDTDSYYATLD